MRHVPRRAAVLAAVLLHGALLLMLQGTRDQRPARSTEEKPALRLVWVEPAAPARAPSTQVRRPAAPATQRPRNPEPAPRAAGAPPAAAAPPPEPAHGTVSAALPAEGRAVDDAASAPPSAAAPAAEPAAAPWNTEATRRAIREAARQVPLGELAASASGEAGPVTAQGRLGQGIGSAALGDCLKGEFTGAGGGLLSLPFWLAAELRGKCRR